MSHLKRTTKERDELEKRFPYRRAQRLARERSEKGYPYLSFGKDTSKHQAARNRKAKGKLKLLRLRHRRGEFGKPELERRTVQLFQSI